MNYQTRIRNLREDHDMNQTRVSDILHVAQTTYSDYEKGKVRMPIDLLMKLAQFYDVDMNYICGLSNIKAPYPKY